MNIENRYKNINDINKYNIIGYVPLYNQFKYRNRNIVSFHIVNTPPQI